MKTKSIKENLKASASSYVQAQNVDSYDFLEGRISGLQLFVFNLFYPLIAGVIGAFANDAGLGYAVLYIFLFLVIIPAYVKRLHDIDKSGWYALFLFIPIVNLLGIIYLFFASGTKGENKYGKDPSQDTFFLF